MSLVQAISGIVQNMEEGVDTGGGTSGVHKKAILDSTMGVVDVEIQVLEESDTDSDSKGMADSD